MGYDPYGIDEISPPKVTKTNLKKFLDEEIRGAEAQWMKAVEESGFESFDSHYWEGRVVGLQTVRVHFIGGTTDDEKVPGYKPFDWMREQ